MANFNNNREIDLNTYLPKALKDVAEFKAIADVETEQTKDIWTACETAMDDQFLDTANVSGVERREKMLGIVPYATDTLADRKFRLASYYSTDVPYTRPKLVEMLVTLCGTNGFVLTYGTHSVDVKVALGVAKQADVVKELLERILPANMVFNVGLLYATWGSLNLKTWSELSSKTWQQVKEEVSA